MSMCGEVVVVVVHHFLFSLQISGQDTHRHQTLSSMLHMGKTFRSLEQVYEHFPCGRIANNHDQRMDCGRVNMAIDCSFSR